MTRHDANVDLSGSISTCYYRIMTTMRENMKKRGITETQLDAARKRLHDHINSYRDGDNDASDGATTLESHGEEPSNGNHDSNPSDHDATYSLRLSFGSTCDVRRPDPDLHFKSDEERFDRNHDVLQKRYMICYLWVSTRINKTMLGLTATVSTGYHPTMRRRTPIIHGHANKPRSPSNPMTHDHRITINQTQ